MAIMMGKLYSALRAGNVPENEAREAAEEAAEFKNSLGDLRMEFKDSIGDVKSTLRLHGWILTFNTAMIVAVVGKLFLGH